MRSEGNLRGVVAGIAGVVVLVAVVAAALWLAPMAAAAPVTPRTCNITVNTENVANDSVQSAINIASPGWTVCVGAGSFPEQLTISTPGLTLSGAGPTLTIFDPPSLAVTTSDWDSVTPSLNASNFPVAPMILVENTSAVTLKGFAVNGSAAATTWGGCSPGFVGVEFQNSSGKLTGAAVDSILLPPALQGCQTGLGVLAYTGFFGTGFVPSSPLKVTVSQTSVAAFDKNGITCNDPGLSCTVTADTVIGQGPTPATAQNGIQIGFGAKGIVNKDKVSATDYTGSTAVLSWYAVGFQATGILLYNAAAGTAVLHCTLTGNAMGIADVADAANQIVGNTVLNSAGYGIVVNGVPGTNEFIGNNTLKAAPGGGVGILVDNGTFNLTDNRVAGTSASGGNGASQAVCGTGAFLACTPTQSVSTAGIQAVSESSVGPTVVVLSKNEFTNDNLSLATLAVLGGAVNLQFVP
jgi:hypothetical protein